MNSKYLFYLIKLTAESDICVVSCPQFPGLGTGTRSSATGSPLPEFSENFPAKTASILSFANTQTAEPANAPVSPLVNTPKIGEFESSDSLYALSVNYIL